MTRINSGFTLMEIMVSLAILAVITGIAIPSYNGYMRNSYLAECSKEIAVIQLAQEEFFLENNAYFPNPPGIAPDIATMEADSNGVYVSSYTVANNAPATAANIAAANCTYSVTSNAGPGYTITATGQNKLTAAEVITKLK